MSDCTPPLDAALKLVLAITYQYHHLQQKQERVEEVPVKSEAIKVPAEPAKAPEPIQTACVALPVPAAPPAAAVPAPAPPAPAAPPLPTAPQQQVVNRLIAQPCRHCTSSARAGFPGPAANAALICPLQQEAPQLSSSVARCMFPEVVALHLKETAIALLSPADCSTLPHALAL